MREDIVILYGKTFWLFWKIRHLSPLCKLNILVFDKNVARFSMWKEDMLIYYSSSEFVTFSWIYSWGNVMAKMTLWTKPWSSGLLRREDSLDFYEKCLLKKNVFCEGRHCELQWEVFIVILEMKTWQAFINKISWPFMRSFFGLRCEQHHLVFVERTSGPLGLISYKSCFL